MTDGTSVPLLPDGAFVLGLGRDAPSQQTLVIEGDGGCVQTVQVSQRQYNIQRVEGVPQQTVTPEEVLERIARERQLVRAAKSSA